MSAILERDDQTTDKTGNNKPKHFFVYEWTGDEGRTYILCESGTTYTTSVPPPPNACQVCLDLLGIGAWD